MIGNLILCHFWGSANWAFVCGMGDCGCGGYTCVMGGCVLDGWMYDNYVYDYVCIRIYFLFVHIAHKHIV